MDDGQYQPYDEQLLQGDALESLKLLHQGAHRSALAGSGSEICTQLMPSNPFLR